MTLAEWPGSRASPTRRGISAAPLDAQVAFFMPDKRTGNMKFLRGHRFHKSVAVHKILVGSVLGKMFHGSGHFLRGSGQSGPGSSSDPTRPVPCE